jgi:hypothetical protein
MKKNFTKIIVLIILLFSFSVSAFSQAQWDTLPWKSYADYRLQPLNKSYVTTGVLYDRVFPIAHMDEHTGLSIYRNYHIQFIEYFSLYFSQ